MRIPDDGPAQSTRATEFTVESHKKGLIYGIFEDKNFNKESI